MSGLTRVQTVCKYYQQTTLVGRVNRGAPSLVLVKRKAGSTPESHQIYHYSFSSDVLDVLVPSLMANNNACLAVL